MKVPQRMVEMLKFLRAKPSLIRMGATIHTAFRLEDKLIRVYSVKLTKTTIAKLRARRGIFTGLV